MQSRTIAQLAAPQLLSLGGGSWQDYVSDDGRPYFVYTPANYHVGTVVPLIMMVHGCLQSPSSFAYDTQMNQLADQQQFIVVYPQHAAPGDIPNPMLCWNFFFEVNQHRDSGEAGSLAGIVQAMLKDTSRWTIDASRIYVDGVSSGGGMAVILGATYPNLFAAIGVHSGCEYQWAQWPSPPLLSQPSEAGVKAQGSVAVEPPNDAKLLFHEGHLLGFPPGPDPVEQGQKAYAAMGSFARVVPTIVFHGTDDLFVNPSNGDQVVQQWLRTNQLASGGTFTATFEHPSSTTLGQVPDGHSYTVHTWKDAQGSDIIAYWLVEGMGHAWSGGMPHRPFADPQGPNATQAVYQFFMAHERS